jgi:YidC/Oxa1 family membrane protein insertase
MQSTNRLTTINFILFVVLSAGVLIGWRYFLLSLYPPRPPQELPAETAHAVRPLTPAEQRGQAAAQVWLAPVSWDGWSGLCRLSSALARLPPEWWQMPSWSLSARQAAEPATVISLGVPCPATPTAPLLTLRWASAAASPAPAPTTVLLGGPDYHLQALLTTRGAGVQQLVLNRFQAADYWGRPVYDTRQGQRVPAPLELIPDDPVYPSYTLYHFPQPGGIGEEPSPPVTTLGETLWELEKKMDTGQEQEVRFRTQVPGYDHLTLIKTYHLRRQEYHIRLTLEIRDERPVQEGAPAQAFRYQLAGPHGLPIEGGWYTYTYRQAVIGLLEGKRELVRTLEDARRISHWEGGPRVPVGNRGPHTLLQYALVTNQYFAAGIVVDDRQPSPQEGGGAPQDILAWARPTLETREICGRLERLDLPAGVVEVRQVSGQLAVCRLLPRARTRLAQLALQPGDEVLLFAYEGDEQNWVGDVYPGHSSRPFFHDLTVRVHSERLELHPGEVRAHQFLLYAGPIKVALLAQFSGAEGVDPDLVARYTDTLHLATLTDYHSAGPLGWFASRVGLTSVFIACTKLMHWLLYWLLWLVPSEGLSIILLTVLVRGALFPISRRQALMSQKMQALAPELKKLQEKYKDDPQERTAAMMELYRRHGVNPLGGCLPLFLQMPIFLGLYWALQESIRFRLAPFLWIKNLAAPDMLLYWGEWLPWISDPNNLGGFLYLGPYLNILPVIAVSLMLVHQKMTLPPPADEQQALQQKMMKWMMVLMGIIFYKVAAGLCLYFIASSLWGFAERKLLPRRSESGVPAPVRGAPTAARGGPRKLRGKKSSESGRFQKLRQWWQEILKQAQKK